MYGINLFFSALSIFHLTYLGSRFDLDAEDEKVPSYLFLDCLLCNNVIVQYCEFNYLQYIHCLVVMKEEG